MDFGTATLQHCNTFALLDTIKFNLKHCTKVPEIFSGIKGIKSEDFRILPASLNFILTMGNIKIRGGAFDTQLPLERRHQAEGLRENKIRSTCLRRSGFTIFYL